MCEAYWYPLYAWARKTGSGPEDAADLVQGFFAEVLENSRLAVADPARGRFRSFLRAALANFRKTRWRAASTEKRGGGRRILRLDFEAGERRYRHEPESAETAERIFARKWALTVLGRALEGLEEAYAGRQQQELFAALQPLLDGGGSSQEAAARLGMTEGAVRTALSRLRARLGRALREEVRETLAAGEDVEEELATLMAALG